MRFECNEPRFNPLSKHSKNLVEALIENCPPPEYVMFRAVKNKLKEKLVQIDYEQELTARLNDKQLKRYISTLEQEILELQELKALINGEDDSFGVI